jgi:uncharacterized protein DUF3515
VADRDSRSAARLAALIALPVAVAAGLVVFAVLGGFGSATPGPRPSPATGPVAMAAPSLPAPAATTCRALLARLPDTLDDRKRRPVTAGPEQNAAYGDPAITLACGGPLPSVAPTDDVYVMSGVCWYATPGRDGTAWTAIDRTVPVTVTVPASYDNSGQWANRFSDAIVASVPATTKVPSGCHG